MSRGLRARRAVALGLALLLAPVACARRRQRTHGAARGAADAAELSPAATRAAAALERAERFAASRDRPSYLALRHAIAAEQALWRASVKMPVEVLLGPPRGNEAEGALVQLDLALAEHDAVLIDRLAAQVVGAIRLIAAELARYPTSAAQQAQAASDAAFELGGRALEAVPGSPAGDDAVRADVAGALEGIALLAHDLGAATATADPRTTGAAQSELATALSQLRARDPLQDRASFVVATGQLGLLLRRLARTLGQAPRAPYRPASAAAAAGDANSDAAVQGGADDQAVSILTLPAPRLPWTPAQAALGRELFHDRRLSRGAARSCATCHQPERAYSDGRALPTPLPDQDAIPRNTPTLLYAPLAAAQLWDGKLLTTQAQALAVLHAPAEMGLAEGDLERLLAADAALSRRLEQAFPDGASVANVGRALAAFEAATLNPGTAPIDRLAAGDATALSADERAGLDLFAGRARCTRCHVPPLWGGTRPPDFSVTVYAVLGVPSDATGKQLDGDLGRGRFTRRPQDLGAFKTPTLRNVARTAPYLHNGALPTLAQVIDFYVKGGGKGLGLHVDNQDPDVLPLVLTEDDRRSLELFMTRSLTDAP